MLHDTPMTKIIGVCVVILVMSSALPVLSRTLGNALCYITYNWKVGISTIELGLHSFIISHFIHLHIHVLHTFT